MTSCIAIYVQKDKSQNICISSKYSKSHHEYLKINLKKCFVEIAERIKFISKIDIKVPDFSIYITGICNTNGICLVYNTEKLSRKYLICLAEQILANKLRNTIEKNLEYLDLTNSDNEMEIYLEDPKVKYIYNIRQLCRQNESGSIFLEKIDSLFYMSIIFDMAEKDNDNEKNNCCRKIL